MNLSFSRAVSKALNFANFIPLFMFTPSFSASFLTDIVAGTMGQFTDMKNPAEAG
jgi:hypothetical protein